MDEHRLVTNKELCGFYVCDPRFNRCESLFGVHVTITGNLQMMDVAETAEVLGSGSFCWHLAKSCEMHVSSNVTSVLCMTGISWFFFLMLQPSRSCLKLVCNHFLFHSLSSVFFFCHSPSSPVSSVNLPVHQVFLSFSQFSHFFCHSPSSAVTSLILPVQSFLLSFSQFSSFFCHSPSSAGSSLMLPVQPFLL